MTELDEIRAAVREVVPDVVDLVRRIPNPAAPSLGSWTVADVAAHLSHVFRFDIDAIAGHPVPDAVVTAPGMAELNAKLLADDGDRDPAVLADRLAALADGFDDVAVEAPHVDWLQGVPLPPSVVAGHVLEECLIHGHDIAAATGRPWPIRRRHALLAIEGGVLPLIAALPPTAFVKEGSDFRGRIEVRLRGGGRTVLDFDRGCLTLGTGRLADAYLQADPAALMLVFIGRQGLAKPLLGGKFAAFGPRPWKLLGMLDAINPP